MLPKTLDELPDYLKTAYIEKDGKFEIKPGYAVEDVTNLKNTVGTLKAKTKVFEKALGEYGEIEIIDDKPQFTATVKPGDHASLQKKIADLEKDLKDKDGKDVDVDKLVEERSRDRIAAVTAGHEKAANAAKAKAEEETAVRDKQYRTVAINNAVQGAILKIGGEGKFLEPHLMQLAALDDERNLVLNGPDGNPLIGNDAKNQSLDAYLGELKDSGDWDAAFKVTVHSGPGGLPRGEQSPSGTPKVMALDHGAEFIGNND